MLIKSIKLRNFRQYVNEKIEFATGDKNVTIVHGENGTGKTTLLQAFNWCFYGEADLSHSHMLLSKTVELKMINNEQEEVCVCVEFVHKGILYQFTRKQPVEMLGKKLHYGRSRAGLNYKARRGEWEYYNEDLPDNFIHRIFPKTLASYFLFDGERIKHLGDNSRKGKSDMRIAVSNIMSLDNLYNARDHLKSTKKIILEDYSTTRGDIESKNIKDDIISKEDDIERINEELINVEKNLELYQIKIEEFSEKIKGFDNVKSVEDEREYLMTQINDKKKLMGILANNVRQEYSRNSTSFLATRLYNKAEEYLDKFELKDGVIEGISAKAIDQIITREICLCGKEVHEGCDVYVKLLELKEFLPPKSYGSMVNEFLSNINQSKISCEDFNERIKESYKEYIETKIKIDDLTDQLNKKTAYLENHDIECVRETEKKLGEFRKKYDNANITKGTLNGELKHAKNELKDLEKKRDSILLSNKKNLVIKRREDAANALISYFDDFLMDQEKTVRHHLTQLVEDIFNSVIHKDYNIIIEDNYEFNVKDGNGKDVPMSEGEKQVTSLSFITGIVNMARDEEVNQRFREKIGYDIKEVYPVVMDSPFGSLDIEHRTKISDIVTSLTDQTILFASSSQWLGAVEDKIRDRVGKEYTLQYHSSNNDGEVEEYTKISEVVC